MQNTDMSESKQIYTGPCWAKFRGDYHKAWVMRHSGRTLFHVDGYSELKGLESEIPPAPIPPQPETEQEKLQAELRRAMSNFYVGTTSNHVTDWFPRETWQTKVVNWAAKASKFTGNNSVESLIFAVLFTSILVSGILFLFLGIHLIFQ